MIFEMMVPEITTVACGVSGAGAGTILTNISRAGHVRAGISSVPGHHLLVQVQCAGTNRCVPPSTEPGAQNGVLLKTSGMSHDDEPEDPCGCSCCACSTGWHLAAKHMIKS